MRKAPLLAAVLLMVAVVPVVFLAPTSGTLSRVPLLLFLGTAALVLLAVSALGLRGPRAATSAPAPSERRDDAIDLTGPADATDPDQSVVYKVVLRDRPRSERPHGDAWMMWAADMLEARPGSDTTADAGLPTNDAGLPD